MCPSWRISCWSCWRLLCYYLTILFLVDNHSTIETKRKQQKTWRFCCSCPCPLATQPATATTKEKKKRQCVVIRRNEKEKKKKKIIKFKQEKAGSAIALVNRSLALWCHKWRHRAGAVQWNAPAAPPRCRSHRIHLPRGFGCELALTCHWKTQWVPSVHPLPPSPPRSVLPSVLHWCSVKAPSGSCRIFDGAIELDHVRRWTIFAIFLPSYAPLHWMPLHNSKSN